MTDDQKDLIEKTLQDLTADLQTTLGDGELFEQNGQMYFHVTDKKQLYEVDFDKKELFDLTKKSEVSDSNDPHDTEASCPLKNKKTKKSVDMSEEIKEEETVTEDMTEDTTEDTSKTEVSKMDTGYDESNPQEMSARKKVQGESKTDLEEALKINPSEFKDMIEQLINKRVDEITKDFRAEREAEKAKEAEDLRVQLQKEPYGFNEDFLKGLSLADLKDKKLSIENSKLYKDFLASQEPEEVDFGSVNKEIFMESEDFLSTGEDPWSNVRGRFGGK